MAKSAEERVRSHDSSDGRVALDHPRCCIRSFAAAILAPFNSSPWVLSAWGTKRLTCYAEIAWVRRERRQAMAEFKNFARLGRRCAIRYAPLLHSVKRKLILEHMDRE